MFKLIYSVGYLLCIDNTIKCVSMDTDEFVYGGVNIADLDNVRFAIQLFCHVRWLKTVGRARVCALLDRKCE